MSEKPLLRKIVFWEPTLSPHKSELFQAIRRRRPEIQIVCCADVGLLDERAALGWSVNNADIDVYVRPDDLTIDALFSGASFSTHHIFSGIRWFRTIERGLMHAMRRGAAYSVMSEPRVSEGLLGFARRAQSLLVEAKIRRSVSHVFAIGKHGPRWFRSVGYDERKIIPYAYFVDPPGDLQHREKLDRSARVGFLGRLVKEKGIWDLAGALRLNARHWPILLTIAGDGPDRDDLLSYCQRAGVSVDYRGVVARSAVGKFLSELDVLVLPSTTTNDGWGVVVSEALMMGVPVVVSHLVGAAVVIERVPLFGRVVPAGDRAALSAAISQMLEAAHGAGRNIRFDRAKLARAELSSDYGAKLLLDVLIGCEKLGLDVPALS